MNDKFLDEISHNLKKTLMCLERIEDNQRRHDNDCKTCGQSKEGSMAYINALEQVRMVMPELAETMLRMEALGFEGEMKLYLSNGTVTFNVKR